MRSNYLKSTNFFNFIRFNAINLLMVNLFAESRTQNSTYSVTTLWDLISSKYISIPYMPYLTIPIVSWGWIATFMKLLPPISALVLFCWPKNRLSYFMMTFALVARFLMSHLAIGVLSTSIYFIPFLLVCLQPVNESQFEQIRNRVILALSMMYLFSALHKMNGYYLSGATVEYMEPSRIFGKTIFDYSPFARLYAWGGVLLETLASLIVIKRLRTLALFAALLFHFLVAIRIYQSIPILLFSCSLLLLFSENEKLQKYYRNLLCIAIIFPVALYLIANFADYEIITRHEMFHDLFSHVVAICVFIYALININKISNLHKMFFSSLGIMIPTIYATSAIIFCWPEPLGYTQYSGRGHSIYGVSVPTSFADNSDTLKLLSTRWKVVFRKDLIADHLTALFPFEFQAEEFSRFLCQLNPHISMTKFHSSHTVQFVNRGKINLDQIPLTSEDSFCY
jgi:hypothetical protein